MTIKKDLWGNLESTQNLTLPYLYTRLQEQGELLSEKTNGLLIGELVINKLPTLSYQSFVERYETLENTNTLEDLKSLEKEFNLFKKNLKSLKPEFCYLFRIKAPCLNNYHIYILEIQYGVNSYPVYVTDLTKDDIKPKKCHNQEQFDEIIESILSSNIVTQTIVMLLEESKQNTD